MRTSKYAGFLPDVVTFTKRNSYYWVQKSPFKKTLPVNSLLTQNACLDFFFPPAQGAKIPVP